MSLEQVGSEGAGHFVKMVHNGIEYGDMQLICEAYHLMKDVLGMEHNEMAKVRPRPCPQAAVSNPCSEEKGFAGDNKSFLILSPLVILVAWMA